MVFRVFALPAILFFSLSFAGEAIQNAPEPEKGDSGVAPSKIAKEFGITEDSVHTLKAAYKIGYGGVSKALALSKTSGLSAEDILRMKTEGKMGWGRIRQELEGRKGSIPGDKALEIQEKKQLKAEEKAEKKAEKAEQKSAKGRDK